MKILQRIIPKIDFRYLVSSLMLAVMLLYSLPSQAALDYGVGRVRECQNPNNNGEIQVEGLDFNPTGGGKDVEFVMTNPICVTVSANSYTLTKLAIARMNATCGSGNPNVSLAPNLLMDSVSILRATRKAALPSTSPQCRSAYALAVGAMATSIGQLAIIYAIAETAFQNSRICGDNWLKPDSSTYTISLPDRKGEVQQAVERATRNDPDNLTKTKEYREWFNGGVEIYDDPADGSDEVCRDPTGGELDNYADYPRQVYYLKGLPTGNYNCDKYDIFRISATKTMTGRHKEHYLKAYNCCKQRMREYICIEYDPDGALEKQQKFCRAGSTCEIQGVHFRAQYIDNNRLICAESYSLCPYNYALGGGTEFCDYYRDGIWNEDEGRWKMITTEQIENGECSQNSEIRKPDCTFNEKAGQCKNYCQYLRHCTITGGTNYVFTNGLSSPYYSQACIDFVGDSQNRAAIEGGVIFGSQRHFSAPIAQCVKESLENLFYNRAGHSRCAGVNEYPSPNGDCPSGQYVTDGDFLQKKGNQVERESLFSLIQSKMNLAVKMTLTLSIMFYGMNILVGRNNIGNKKDILVYILKIGLVMYFATGQAWQTMFFNGVYGSSMEFAMMVFKIGTEENPEKQDGCQFGKITLKDGSTISSGTTYPTGKEYLAIWDTLDCKIARYLGFGPDASAASIAWLIFASFFTGPIGLYFAISMMFFGILLVTTTIRALHIFLSSAILIILFVFISPIIIPMALFKRTESIFKNWLTNLITFILQPMILFAYIAILVSVMDKVLIGSAKFIGDPPMKSISCQKQCIDGNGDEVPYVNDQPPECGNQGETLINPLDDSVACLLKFDDFGKEPGFEIIGLAIPILDNLFSENTKERVLTILKAVLIIYLLYKFMDEIPGIASSLIGGSPLPGANVDALKVFKGTAGFLSEVQKRAKRGIAKQGKDRMKKAREGGEEATNKGKSVKEASTQRTGGSHGTGSSGSGGSGSGSSSSGGSSGSGNSGGGGSSGTGSSS